jgi:hypothetical protein
MAIPYRPKQGREQNLNLLKGKGGRSLRSKKVLF